MRARHIAVCLGLLPSMIACGGSQPPPEPVPPPAPPAELPPAAVETQTAPAAAAVAPELTEAKKPASPTPVVRYAQGIATPESVLYDAAADRYLVSNVNGAPLDADNNGYIMELSPEGAVTKEKFIAGGVNNAKLDAPKGIGISGGVLYVADITVVRKFDAKTGAPKGDIAVPGATFLNDIAVGPDGKVYVSDSGMKFEAGNFGPTGTDAVYVIQNNKPKAIAKSTELGQPNGLLVTDKGLLVNTFGSNEVYRLDEKGVRHDVTKLPEGGLDGLNGTADTLFVSSWKGQAIYKGKLGGTFEAAFTGLNGPADFGIDAKRNRLLLPRFLDHAVEVYPLP
ncbi:MAG TPA: hypothetical protein VIM73_19185 [Polyangiaceae bacterium]